MNLTFSWEAVTAGCALAALIGAGTALFVKSVVRDEINEAFKRLNGTYTRAKECVTLHQQIETRLATIEDRIAIIEEKAL